MRPPRATIMPPYHTHHTRGLMVKRNTACSVPLTKPASTTYRYSRRSLRMPTLVEVWDVGRPRPSTCLRLWVVRTPMRLASGAISSVEVAHPAHQQHQRSEPAHRHGHGELPLQVRERGAAPGDERSDPGEREQGQPERDVHLIEERRADGDFRPLHQLREDREQRAPQ